MSGQAHYTCDAKVHCPFAVPSRCLCGLMKEDLRQKYLDPALVYVRDRDDSRIIHFIQHKFEKSVSEYRTSFGWPDSTHPAIPYVQQKSTVRWELKDEQDQVFSKVKEEVKPVIRGKGIAERIFEK